MDRSNRIQKIVVTALAVFLLQACDKVPKGGDAQLSVSLTSPSQKAVTQSSFAKPQSHTAGEVTLFNRVELTVKNRNGEILTGGNLGDGHSSVSLTVPSQIPLLLEGSAFLNGTLLYRGSAPVLPIRPGGSSRARLVLFAVDASGEQIPIDIGLNEKPSPAVSEASVITNNNRLVLFSSTASDLVEGDTNNSRDLFLKDLISNETINVHTDKDGNSANADVGSAAEHADMSADGRYVVFSSLASNLVEGDDNQLYDVYLKDLSDGSIQRIPRPVDITGSYNALYPQISDDGSRIAFVLKSIDGSQMLYILYDSRREEPTVGIVNSIVGLPQMSGDGNRFVYTTAAENRLYVETRFSGTPQAETVFNPDDDVTRFQVAISYDGDTLIVVPSHNYGDMFANHVYRVYWGEGVATELLSTDLDGELLGSEPKTDINVSDDGRFVVFVYNGVVYVKELASGLLQALRPGTRPFVSADGSYIGYTSSADQRLFYEVNPFVDPPATPQNIVAIPGDKTISLSWDADENASGFRLYVSPASGITQTNYTQIDGAEVFSVEGNSFTYPGELVNGQVYYFIVSAVEGTLESAASSELSAVPSLLLGQSDLPFTGELGAGVLSEFLTISGLQSGKTYQFFFNPIGSSIGARIFSDANKNNLLCEIQFTTFLNDCSFSLVESNEAYVEIALNQDVGLASYEFSLFDTTPRVIVDPFLAETIGTDPEYVSITGLVPNSYYRFEFVQPDSVEIINYSADFSNIECVLDTSQDEIIFCLLKSDESGALDFRIRNNSESPEAWASARVTPVVEFDFNGIWSGTQADYDTHYLVKGLEPNKTYTIDVRTGSITHQFHAYYPSDDLVFNDIFSCELLGTNGSQHCTFTANSEGIAFFSLATEATNVRFTIELLSVLASELPIENLVLFSDVFYIQKKIEGLLPNQPYVLEATSTDNSPMWMAICASPTFLDRASGCTWDDYRTIQRMPISTNNRGEIYVYFDFRNEGGFAEFNFDVIPLTIENVTDSLPVSAVHSPYIAYQIDGITPESTYRIQSSTYQEGFELIGTNNITHLFRGDSFCSTTNVNGECWFIPVIGQSLFLWANPYTPGIDSSATINAKELVPTPISGNFSEELPEPVSVYQIEGLDALQSYLVSIGGTGGNISFRLYNSVTFSGMICNANTIATYQCSSLLSPDSSGKFYLVVTKSDPSLPITFSIEVISSQDLGMNLDPFLEALQSFA